MSDPHAGGEALSNLEVASTAVHASRSDSPKKHTTVAGNPEDLRLDLPHIVSASRVSFDQEGNLVAEGSNDARAVASPPRETREKEDEDGELEASDVSGLHSDQPLLSAEPTQLALGLSQDSRPLPAVSTGPRNPDRYVVNEHFPLNENSWPSVADLLSIVVFGASTVGFFACAVVATDVTDAPSCHDAAWDTITPYLEANDLDYRDCTELVHVLSCEYALRQDGDLPMRQILNLCGGSCQVCGVTWLGKDDMGVGRWALYLCSLVAPFLGLAWSRVYLSPRNRGDVLQLAQYLPGPLFVCLAMLLVSLDGGVVSNAAAAILLCNALVSFSSASSDRFQAACRAGELLEATIGNWVGQLLSILFGGAAAMFFVAWSSVFVSVLDRPVDSASAAMLAYLFFYAYWASYICMAVYIMTLSGATVALLGKGASYHHHRKVQVLLSFLRRALRPRALGVACRWGFVGGSGMLLWTAVTGLRQLTNTAQGQQRGGACVRRLSLTALPVIQVSHRALLLHVALNGSSVRDARDKTWQLLARILRDIEQEPGQDANKDGRDTINSSNVVEVLNNSEKLDILDADYYEYAPLIGPGISACFAATMVCGVCLLFFVDAAGATLLLLAAFTATHATTTISLLGVSTVMDAVRMAFLMQPEQLRCTFPILHHRLMRLHFIKRQQRQQQREQQQQPQQLHHR